MKRFEAPSLAISKLRLADVLTTSIAVTIPTVSTAPTEPSTTQATSGNGGVELPPDKLY